MSEALPAALFALAQANFAAGTEFGYLVRENAARARTKVRGQKEKEKEKGKGKKRNRKKGRWHKKNVASAQAMDAWGWHFPDDHFG